MAIQRAKVGDVELAYEVMGTGTPMVLIMGIGAQLVFWEDGFCQALVDRGFQVIRFDHRDLGESTRLDHLPVPRPWPTLLGRVIGRPAPAPYTLSDMARDVTGLLDALAIDRAHIVGVSMGGMIAQHLAIEHPRRVRSMTSIMSTTGALWASRPRPEALRALLMPRPRTVEQAEEIIVRSFKVIGSRSRPPDEARLRALARRSFLRGQSPRGFLRQLAAIMASGDRTSRLRRVRTPTLVIHGREDPLIPIAAGRATARAIPGARLLELDEMGHDLSSHLWPRLVDAIAAHALAN